MVVSRVTPPPKLGKPICSGASMSHNNNLSILVCRNFVASAKSGDGTPKITVTYRNTKNVVDVALLPSLLIDIDNVHQAQP